jgi:uncharacterized membrane protein YbhN (UPF0104 family)
MRRTLLLIAKIAISATLLFLALRGIDLQSAASRLAGMHWGWFALAVTAALFQIAFGALRWREIAFYCHAALPAARALRFSLIGAFFNQTLPSSIGGDAVRLWLLSRSAGWRAATYSVLIDRGIGLLALSTVILLGLPWSMALIADPHGQITLIVLNAIALGGGAVFLALGRVDWPWLRNWWATRDIHACAVIAGRALFSARSGPILVAVSLSIHLLAVLIGYCAAKAVAAPFGLSQAVLLLPPVMLVTMLPVSIAGWGLREAAMMVAFSYAGLASSDGFLVSLVFGIAMVAVGAIGGLVWILTGDISERATPPDTTHEDAPLTE